MKYLLTGEQVEAIKKLREIYENSRMQGIEEGKRIWAEEIKPNFNDVITEDWIIMNSEVFDYIVGLTDKIKSKIT